MKRSVAIYGPTPQFVRWAIGHCCPLRETDVDNLPDSTFRQLRGLRELSMGLMENRVFENICVHPASADQDAPSVRGFKAHEVLDAHGDAAYVGNCCRSCPANAVAESRPGTWAGCYGWLPAISGFCLESTLRVGGKPNELSRNQVYQPGRLDFVKLLDDVIKHSALKPAGELFNKTTPRWYGLWQNSLLTHEQVEYLQEIFESAVSHCLNERAALAEIADLIQFRDALKRCVEHRLTLHVDLVPPGISDGQTWTLSAHCPDCKIEMPTSGRQQCSACGKFGNPHGQRKSKVLGLRPYVNLVGVMGEPMTAEFMRRFNSQPSAVTEKGKRGQEP